MAPAATPCVRLHSASIATMYLPTAGSTTDTDRRARPRGAFGTSQSGARRARRRSGRTATVTASPGRARAARDHSLARIERWMSSCRAACWCVVMPAPRRRRAQRRPIRTAVATAGLDGRGEGQHGCRWHGPNRRPRATAPGRGLQATAGQSAFRAAGGVVVAKANLEELSFRSDDAEPDVGIVSQSLGSQSRIRGGSSGGSAVAVAAGRSTLR